jgi:hypothetical protein
MSWIRDWLMKRFDRNLRKWDVEFVVQPIDLDAEAIIPGSEAYQHMCEKASLGGINRADPSWWKATPKPEQEPPMAMVLQSSRTLCAGADWHVLHHFNPDRGELLAVQDETGRHLLHEVVDEFPESAIPGRPYCFARKGPGIIQIYPKPDRRYLLCVMVPGASPTPDQKEKTMDEHECRMRETAMDYAVKTYGESANPDAVVVAAQVFLAFLKVPDHVEVVTPRPTKHARAYSAKGETPMSGLGGDCGGVVQAQRSISRQGYLALHALASTTAQTVPVYLDSEDARTLLAAIEKR